MKEIQIIEKTKAFGASLAGITSIASLKNSPSHKLYGKADWPLEAKSLIVLALAHEKSKPELDWWGNREGGSAGNRQMESIMAILSKWLREEFHIKARPLPYHVEKGGIFLKDAASLAGLGVLGQNNLLVTPEFGPRVRLRALWLNAELQSNAPIDFTPCATCAMPCIDACPRKAFENGRYIRALCNVQMRKDEASGIADKNLQNPVWSTIVIRYCRACELACPMGR